MNTDTIETRVARGAALMDKQRSGWLPRINLDRLDLSSPCRCIFGQEFVGASGFDVGLRELFGGDIDMAAAHGFTIAELGEDFRPLTAEWRRVILARRGGVS